MKVISISEFHDHLEEMLDKVAKSNAPVTVARDEAGSVVLMSLDEYEALEETAHLLRSPENTRRLRKSISELESGGGTERTLVD